MMGARTGINSGRSESAGCGWGWAKSDDESGVIGLIVCSDKEEISSPRPVKKRIRSLEEYPAGDFDALSVDPAAVIREQAGHYTSDVVSLAHPA